MPVKSQKRSHGRFVAIGESLEEDVDLLHMLIWYLKELLLERSVVVRTPR